MITTVHQGVAMAVMAKAQMYELWRIDLELGSWIADSLWQFFFLLAVIVISKWFKNLMLYKFIMKMDSTSLHIWG